MTSSRWTDLKPRVLSAAGLIAYQPVVAQSEGDYVRAFGNSAYTYCDAKLVGQLWGMDPYEGKIQIGMKIVGGYVENLVDVLQSSRNRGHGCEWADTGLTYDNAEALARVWGTTPWEAKARAHLERQPLIRGIIVSALKKNPVLPWGKPP